MSIILKTIHLSKNFGGLHALSDVNIQVNNGEIVGIIGPNGAGKTTLFNVISGFLKPSQGRVILDNEDISKMAPSTIVKKGIARTFQLVRPLKDLTVFQNILVAVGYLNYFGIKFFRKWKKEEYLNHAKEILKLVGLEKYKNKMAGTLPLGIQKRIEIAKALAVDPKVLLLDEPTAGMSYEESEEIKSLIKNVNQKGVTILLVEHNVPFAVDLVNRMYVLSYGKIIAKGNPEDVIKNEKVIKAYLGEEYEHS